MNNKSSEISLSLALDRILSKKTLHISPQRKLSVRAVEEEACLGNGSCYYYPSLIEKIKLIKLSKKINTKRGKATSNSTSTLKENKELLKKYQSEIRQLRKLNQDLVTQYSMLSILFTEAQETINKLEKDIAEIKKKTY